MAALTPLECKSMNVDDVLRHFHTSRSLGLPAEYVRPRPPAEEELGLFDRKRDCVRLAYLIRNGQRVLVPVNEVSLGDLVVLNDGDYPPGEVRVVETLGSCQVYMGRITGEFGSRKVTSAAIEGPLYASLEEENMIPEGCFLAWGHVIGVVVAIGQSSWYTNGPSKIKSVLSRDKLECLAEVGVRLERLDPYKVIRHLARLKYAMIEADLLCDGRVAEWWSFADAGPVEASADQWSTHPLLTACVLSAGFPVNEPKVKSSSWNHARALERLYDDTFGRARRDELCAQHPIVEDIFRSYERSYVVRRTVDGGHEIFTHGWADDTAHVCRFLATPSGEIVPKSKEWRMVREEPREWRQRPGHEAHGFRKLIVPPGRDYRTVDELCSLDPYGAIHSTEDWIFLGCVRLEPRLRPEATSFLARMQDIGVQPVIASGLTRYELQVILDRCGIATTPGQPDENGAIEDPPPIIEGIFVIDQYEARRKNYILRGCHFSRMSLSDLMKLQNSVNEGGYIPMCHIGTTYIGFRVTNNVEVSVAFENSGYDAARAEANMWIRDLLSVPAAIELAREWDKAKEKCCVS